VTSPTAAAPRAYDVEGVRRDFPILSRTMRGKPLAFLDNAASSQKPRAVIDAERRVYEEYYANIHRGVYEFSMRSTEAFEKARSSVQRLLNARSSREIVFTRGTTESINLVASSYGRKHVGPRDEVLISAMEHHSNIVPWQMLCEERGATLRVAPIDASGAIVLPELDRLIGPRTRIISVAHVSNALGTINPIEEIVAIARAHAHGVRVLVDGAQAAPRLPVDVQRLGVDFYAFSGHKAYGPSGAGALYGRLELLEEMPPYQGGGDMILSVTFGKTIYNEVPHKFEAGTPNIAGTIALGAAAEYLMELGLERIDAYESELLAYATEQLSSVPGIEFIGTAERKAGVISFVLEGIHPHDIGTILDYEGIAIRTGHHCAQPVMDRFGVPATARASLGLYNTREEIDRLRAGILKVQETFR
jgi:cysteine desulfurase/selenocysteine lyase